MRNVRALHVLEVKLEGDVHTPAAQNILRVQCFPSRVHHRQR